jgi:arabinofuranan 3-O-arabinosyltransferase
MSQTRAIREPYEMPAVAAAAARDERGTARASDTLGRRMVSAQKTRRELTIPAALGALSFALAFVQRPGLITADTKINLHVDPGRFLSDVASMWTSTGQLGDVQAGQQAGYLFPMGPFFAAGHALGIPDWVVQRLWLGALLALAAWGAVRLIDALYGRPRGLAQIVGGAALVLNPFVVTYVNRTTVTLLAYAALPWLMLVVHRGLERPRGWRWPAAFALLVAASGGGVNGAVTAWMLVGPALLLLYEAAFASASWRAVGGFAARAVVLTVIVSLWWIVPAYVQSSYGIDFLHFTEQPGTIWGTTSATESLRLMSFWLSYVGVGFAGRAIGYFDDSRTLLFSAPVVVATLLIPAASLTGFVWARRWRYGPFFLAMALVAVLIMMAGFPSAPLRHGLTFTYNHVAAVRFLRASYKAAPLLALALACLAGVGAAGAWARLGSSSRAGAWRAIGTVAGAAVLVGASWPLVTGKAQDAQVSFTQVPAAWREAAAGLDRELPANSRAMVLPGDLFSFYTWGGTVDPILPALSRRPVAERAEVPYADLRATELQWTIDSLVHQQRLLPGQLDPLLSLIGVGSVITGSDDDLARSDAPPPADAAAQLATQPGFATPARSYGPVRSFAPSSLGPPVRLPQVRRYDLPSARGLIRVEPRANPLLVDGSADALAGLAAFGQLPAGRAILYTADLSPAQLRATAARGAGVVISDSNARQAFVSGSLEQNVGPVLTPQQTVSADGIMLDPFSLGTEDQTVASYGGGVRSVEAPASPQIAQFPEHRPFAAVDGSPATAWLADPTLGAAGRWLQVDFDRSRAVPYVYLLPYGDAGGTVKQVQVAGRTFAVHPGWNRLALNLSSALGLRVTLTQISPPAPGAAAGAGGIRELRIPGVQPTEQLRSPFDATSALAGANLGRVALTYLFQRQTGDDPYQRDLAHGPWSARDVNQPGDAEQVIRRVFQLPAIRTFSASAWVNVFASAPDDALDRLAGYRGPVQATSSSRFDGQPRYRASSALDGVPGTSWIGDYTSSSPAWLQVASPSRLTVSTLRLGFASTPVRRPSRVRMLWPGGSTPALPVRPGGLVVLPRPVRTHLIRLQIVSAAAPAEATAAQRRAVGIAALGGIRGLGLVRTRRTGAFTAACGAVRMAVANSVMALRVSGSAAAFEDGSPLYARSCGPWLTLGVGTHRLVVAPGTFAVDALRLSSPAPTPPPAALPGGRVLNSGTAGHGSYDHVRVSVSAPSWLVLGEGYDRGWQATCNGRSLGAPTPIDGYGNGWSVQPGCRAVSFTFTPNRLAEIGYIVSGAGALVCLILLLLPLARRRPAAGAGARRAPAPDADRLLPDRPARWRPARAVLAAVPAAAVFAFLFGAEAGIVSLPVIAVCLWRGVAARALTLAAGGLLGIVVPVLYVVHPGDEQGGNHFTYAMVHIAAHWVGVAALGLLIGALWRVLAAQRSSRTQPADRREAGSPTG